MGTWKKQALEGLGSIFETGPVRDTGRETEVRDLHAKIVELAVQNDFFIYSAQAQSRKERKTMIDRSLPTLSVSAQYKRVAISAAHSAGPRYYYRPKGESPETLALMRKIEALFMKYPFYGSRQMARHLARDGDHVGRHRVRRLMRLMGLQAIYRAPKTSRRDCPEFRALAW